MSVNRERPHVCLIPGCGENENGNGLHLCPRHYMELVLMRNDGQIDDPPYDEDTREIIITLLAERDTFDTECATVFDAQGHELYQAPIRLVRDYSGRVNS